MALLLVAGSALGFPSGAAGADRDQELVAVKAELSQTKTQLDATRAELATTRDALARLTTKVDALEAAGPGAASAAPSGPRLPPVNADNPAISFVVDTTFSSDTKDGRGADFALRSGELFISAPVDPFVRAFTTINGSSEEGFDIEEAAIVTTSLPY